MKIISKFKDYYDHVGQRYGEDPTVVYNRGMIHGAPAVSDAGFVMRWLNKHVESPKDQARFEPELIVAGELDFVVVKVVTRTKQKNEMGEPIYTTEYRHIDESLLYWIEGHDPNKPSRWHWNSPKKIWGDFQNSLTTFRQRYVLPAQMKLQVPVLHVTRMGILEKVPVLQDYGIPALMKPELMWQHLYDFFVNRLRPNPDKDVPVELSNDAKIQKAGFDLKSSFRNPVNPKPKKR